MADDGYEIIFLAGHLAGADRARSLAGLADRLGALGHVPRVICLSAGVGHAPTGLTECPGLGRRWRLPWAAWGLRSLGDDPLRPRLIHVLESGLGAAGLELAERWGIPYLLGVDEFPGRGAKFRLSRAWCRGLVAANDELAGAIVRDYGVPARWVHAVPRGVCPPDELATGRVEGRVPVVGAAGPLVQGSGFATFLSAARRVIDAGVDAEFLIAGQGEDEIELRRRAERLKIADRITFADDREGHLAFWDVLDVFCQTSVASTVGRSLAVAMTHGVPAIAADVEGMRALVRDGETGLVVPPGDPGALARAIMTVLANPEHARAIGERGRDASRLGHDPDREAARLDVLYREVMAEPEIPAPEPVPAPAIAVNPGRPAGRIGNGSLTTSPARGPVPRPSRPIS